MKVINILLEFYYISSIVIVNTYAYVCQHLLFYVHPFWSYIKQRNLKRFT